MHRAGAGYIVLLVVLITGWTATCSRPAAPQQGYPNCTEFGFQISGNCCCTNDCCREAEQSEFVHIGFDQYRSNVTGQVLRRTGWSPDGRTIKCACDMVDGVWTKRPQANVRCLFPPLPSS